MNMGNLTEEEKRHLNKLSEAEKRRKDKFSVNSRIGLDGLTVSEREKIRNAISKKSKPNDEQEIDL